MSEEKKPSVSKAIFTALRDGQWKPISTLAAEAGEAVGRTLNPQNVAARLRELRLSQDVVIEMRRNPDTKVYEYQMQRRLVWDERQTRYVPEDHAPEWRD